jgi:LysM repeat protein
MDRDGQLLASVLRERSAHGRRLAMSRAWLGAPLVLLVVIAGATTVRMIVAPTVVEERAPTTDAPGSEAVATTASELLARNVATPDDEPRIARATAALTPAAPLRYVVQPGDTLRSIAERHGLRAATLASVNGLVDPDVVQAGRELLVPATDGLVHVVQPGETLQAIADRYAVDLAAIVTANALADPEGIAIGLRLFIPTANAA